jgi:hypothetical protein
LADSLDEFPTGGMRSYESGGRSRSILYEGFEWDGQILVEADTIGTKADTTSAKAEWV